MNRLPRLLSPSALRLSAGRAAAAQRSLYTLSDKLTPKMQAQKKLEGEVYFTHTLLYLAT